MESLGEKLKAAREARGVSIDQISGETNISGRYLEALEKEDFSPFPGEPYIQGFLKSYGEYLGFSADEVLSLYRALKIQEQPVPMEQLLKNPSPAPKIIGGIVIVAAIAAIAFGAVTYLPILLEKPPAPVQEIRMASEYALNADFLERRFYPGDSILVSEGSDNYKLIFASLSDAVTITTPGGPVMLDLGQEVTIDLNNSSISELRIIAADFSKNDSTAGAVLRFEQTMKPQGPIETVTSGIPMEVTISEREAVTVIYPGPTGAAPASAFPFTLQAVFQGYCLFRYEVLFERDRPGRSEQYYQRSEEISITAQNGIRLGISNAQAVKLQVILAGRTYTFETGAAGEVVAADLRWVRDDDNRFRLVLVRLD